MWTKVFGGKKGVDSSQAGEESLKEKMLRVLRWKWRAKGDAEHTLRHGGSQLGNEV